MFDFIIKIELWMRQRCTFVQVNRRSIPIRISYWNSIVFVHVKLPVTFERAHCIFVIARFALKRFAMKSENWKCENWAKCRLRHCIESKPNEVIAKINFSIQSRCGEIICTIFDLKLDEWTYGTKCNCGQTRIGQRAMEKLHNSFLEIQYEIILGK